MAVDAACDACRSIAGQALNFGTATLTTDGTGTDALPLPRWPVTSAGTVTVDGGTVTDYVLDAENGVLYRSDASGLATVVWPEGRQNVTVTYVHGYQTVPRDLRMVAIHIAERLVVQGPAMRESNGQQSVDYAAAATDFTRGELLVLRKYAGR